MQSQSVNVTSSKDNDLLSLILNVKSPPVLISVVMEESVIEERVTTLIPVTFTNAVVSADIL